uniref:Uncharacterized protein n=1 Tax=Arundo donax TaxID=35708 RepID=A0A0A8ZC65_ARUDO
MFWNPRCSSGRL